MDLYEVISWHHHGEQCRKKKGTFLFEKKNHNPFSVVY